MSQLVMERTGHRSIEGVRSYKRTSMEQREAVSDILSNTKISCCEVAAIPERSLGGEAHNVAMTNTANVSLPIKKVSTLHHVYPSALITMLPSKTRTTQVAICHHYVNLSIYSMEKEISTIKQL